MRCVTVCPAVSSQPNLLHPMTSIIWRKTSPLPVAYLLASRLQCAIIGAEVFVVGLVLDPRSPVQVYNVTNHSWAIHSWSPTCYAALTTYHSQLVLIGGEEIGTGRVTNRVLVWQEGEWHPSLPPMTVARREASAVSSGNLIIVAGGETSLHGLTVSIADVVELFNGHSWMMAQSLPVARCDMYSVLHNGVWYLGGGVELGRDVFKATVQSIVDSTHRPTQCQVWTRLPPTPHPIYSIAVFNQQLMAIEEGPSSTAICAYFRHTQSWVHVDDIPVALFFSSCALTLPTGDLMVVDDDVAWIGQLEGMECACLQTIISLMWAMLL